jgi:hypothetical protein
MPMSKEVEQGLVAGVFGLVGTLVPAGLAWARDRDVTSARVRRLDEATKRVGFWDQWLKLSTQLTEPGDLTVRDRVRRELTMLCSMIESDSLVLHAAASRQQDQSTAYTVKIDTMPWWRKLLLLYKPERSLAYFPRFMFFLGMFTMAIVLIAQTVSPENKEGFYIILVLLAGWIFIFRYLSRWLEQPRGVVLAAHAATPPPPPPRTP